jgi:hypothetical protein
MGWSICKNITLLWPNAIDRICGHKDSGVILDSKPFGFPFDRNIDFNIHDKKKPSR